MASRIGDGKTIANRARRELAIYLLAALLGSAVACGSAAVREPPVDVPDFEPFKDDLLAERYAPLLLPSPRFGDPVALYYRASRDSHGNAYITYHFLWPYERNDSAGCMPLLSRSIYTGGLSLQRTMFGPGDIELVSLRVDQSGGVYYLGYETAEDYDPRDFGVRHKHMSRSISGGSLPPPFVFEVISWNHLFTQRDFESLSADQRAALVRLTPRYFREELWQQYEMYKPEESFFNRNRAHEEFEREAVE